MLTETHFYDGKLIERKEEIKNFLLKASGVTIESKRVSFGILKSKLLERPLFMGIPVMFYDLLVNSSAFDPTNQVKVDDLLYLCCLISENKNVNINDFLGILIIQLEDMATGFCPQGQTTRLLQIVLSFQEFLKDR